ncbi:MAG: hypothetical protein IPJ86_06185 [Bacteroidetes bacterium]|nr:hypothetical protein [Bacteroidota bacterium]
MITRNTLLFLVIILLLKTGAVFGQKCISNKKAREIQSMLDERKFHDAIRATGDVLSKDSTCQSATFYRAIAYFGLRDSAACLNDLKMLSKASNLVPDDLEILGDYADTLEKFDLSLFFYTKAYKTHKKKPGSVYLKGLKARYKGANRLKLLVVLDSCIRSEIRPAWVYTEVLKLKADVLRYKWEEYTEEKNKLTSGDEARVAYVYYLKRFEPYLGAIDSLPQKMKVKEYCDIYFFIASRYTHVKLFNSSKMYLSYMKQTNCNSKWVLLYDSLTYMNCILQGDYENAAPVVDRFLKRNPHSLFFLREQYKILMHDSVDFSIAILPLLKAIELYPSDTLSLILAARSYEKNKNYFKARQLMDQIREYHGEDVYEDDYIRIKEKEFESNRERNSPELSLEGFHTYQ